MPPCGALNARHILPNAAFVVNELKTAGYPRAKLDEVPGWKSMPETSGGDSIPRVGDVGEDFNPSTSIGKTITYKGRLQAGHGAARSSVELFQSSLAAACWDRSTIQTFLVDPWWDGREFIYKGKILDLQGDEAVERDWNAVPSPWQDDFELSVRMKDGRFYHWNESGVSGQFMSWTDASAIIVDNSGNAPTDPILTVTGVGAGDVHMIREVPGGTDLDLWFRGFDVGPSTLIVDFSVKRAFLNDLLHDVTDQFDEVASTWWDEDTYGVPPGTHTLALGPGNGTSIKADLFSAWW